MLRSITFLIVVGVGFSSYMARSIDPNCIQLPSSAFNYANIPFPSDVLNNITEMDNMPGSNPTTDAGATLGRVLFYDIDLSKNHKVACASCHLQEFSFTDTAQFSTGFNGVKTRRNSMGLVHARFLKDSAFFWDNRAVTLEAQTLEPIISPVEMGLTIDTLVTRVAAKSFYPSLFQAVFGTPIVNAERIAKALAQFVRSINSFGSKFRQGVEVTAGNPSVVSFANFTPQENLGKNLFMDERRGNCQACHTRNIMVPQGSKNIGLDLVYSDNGVGEVSGNTSKNGQFSVPSLINVELTAPYMHDGRYKTLEQVINFYSDSIQPHPQLDGFLREIVPGNPSPNNNPCSTCPPRKIRYTIEEKAALVAFLKTLTDTTLLKDIRWSNPFCEKSGTSVLNSVLSVNLYPNPINQGLSAELMIMVSNNFFGHITVLSSTGQLVYQLSRQLFIGANKLSIPTAGLPRGIYFLIISGTNRQPLTTKKMIIVD